MKKILVIDDEAWLREMVNMALAQKGYEVLEAENGCTGVDVARKLLPDLILCDVNMEQMDGYGTLSSLRDEATTASIPFILMTGLADNAGMRHGMELGADDYLPKPFTIDALYGAVEARLKKVQAVREAAERKLGRRPGVSKGPRAIDIDILLYENASVRSPALTIPHPRMAERRFVLVPLQEIAPHLRHPVTQRTLPEMLSLLTNAGQVIRLKEVVCSEF